MKPLLFLGSAVLMVAMATPAVAQGRGGGAVASQGRGTATKPSTPPAAKPKVTPPTVAEHLAQQPQLTAKLQPLLPAGMKIETAAAGFKNLGAFVSAVHVSKNLDIPFDQLKAKLTGDKPETLGQAIHDLKPTADAAAEVKKAEAQAKEDQRKGKGKGH